MLIKFQDASDNFEVHVNPEAVAALKDVQGCAVIHLTGGAKVVVAAPLPDVAKRLGLELELEAEVKVEPELEDAEAASPEELPVKEPGKKRK